MHAPAHVGFVQVASAGAMSGITQHQSGRGAPTGGALETEQGSMVHQPLITAPCARRWVLEELRRNLAKELDFRLEAGNAQLLAAAMAGRRSVAVPRPVPEVGGCCPLWLVDLQEKHATSSTCQGCLLEYPVAGSRKNRQAYACPVLSRFILSCPVLSCPVLSCPVLSCPVLSCPVLSCPVLRVAVRMCLP